MTTVLWRRSLGDIRSRRARLLTAVAGAAAGGVAALALPSPPGPLILVAAVLAGIMASWSP